VDGNGFILVADATASKVIGVDPQSGAQSTIASGGSLSAPYGVAIESTGKIVVFDQAGAGAVVRVDPSNGAQFLIATGGSFADPFGIAVLPSAFPAPPPVSSPAGSVTDFGASGHRRRDPVNGTTGRRRSSGRRNFPIPSASRWSQARRS
jgi:hypothetical protein